MEEKSPLAKNERINSNLDNISMLLNISVVDGTIPLYDNRVIGYRSYNHNPNDEEQKIVIFFPGAGFGRTHNPFYSDDDEQLFLKQNISLIIIERPGYGQSSSLTDINRTYKLYADDINFICKKYFKFSKPVYFMAHSAGCGHLLSVAAFYPHLIKQCAIVCPPNPLIGNVPNERPNENGTRSIQRCCVVNCLCCLLCCFRPLVNGWKNDAKQFTKFSKQNFAKLPEEKKFFEQNTDFIEKQENDFNYAVCKSDNDGVNAMIQDMFILNSRDWGFKIGDINVSKIFVWYGTEDDVTPNGKWYCNVLKNSEERKVYNIGHAAIYIKRKDILMDLISD